MNNAPKYERILIATTNRGKAAEIAILLEGCAAVFVMLDELPPVDEPAETASTFAENARLKADYYARSTGLPSVADDSGLMVDALNGAPGVHSARLVDTGAGDAARNEKLLDMLAGFKNPDDRSAQFVCVACFADPKDSVVIIEEGLLRGRIAFAPDGQEGFGFDPLFIPDGYDKTVASLGINIKNEISHRRMAFEKLALRIRAL
jgi:XTP/dITP diphosphohydrolase